VRHLDLRVQIDRGGEVQIQQLDGLAADGFVQGIMRLLHGNASSCEMTRDVPYRPWRLNSA
jgi:hypothetical protein